MIRAGATIWSEAFFEGLRPAPVLGVNEWANAHRVLSSRSSAEPGPWRTRRTPYLAELMDSLGPACPAERVVFMKGAQIGGSEAGHNWLGSIMHETPAATMVVLPTVDLGKKWSKQRLDPMIQDSPALAARVQNRRSRDAGNTVLFKEFPGGVLAIVGANSGSGLRSMPFRFLMADEVDAFPGDVEGEGDPLILAERGTRTYSRRKIFLVSTPTFRGRSRIEREFNLSDRRFYHVPCPHCGELQRLEWRRLKWDGYDPSTVRYICEWCQEEIFEHQKTAMLEGGVWIPEEPDRSDSIRGYHLSALYSPVGWRSWEQIVTLFLKGTGKLVADDGGRGSQPDILRVWTNHDLGETWAEAGDAPAWEAIYTRREDYKIGTVPAGVCVLTCGVDVQGDRLELEVIGWGRALESWSIAYLVLSGSPTDREVWLELDKVLETNWPSADPSLPPMRIRITAVDAGYETQHVRGYVRRKRGDRVIAVRGRENFHQPIGQPKKVEVTIRGRTIKRGVLEWPVGVDDLKSELYGWLKMGLPTHPEVDGYPPGWCHLPQYAEEFFRQLTAEQVEARIVRGYRRYQWTKIRERNEALDCRVYNRAALAVIGGDRWGEDEWAALEGTRGAEASAQPRRRGGRRDRLGRGRRGSRDGGDEWRTHKPS